MKIVDVSRIRSRFDEPLIARDGVRLSVDVYLPPDEGRYPVLITRTPYDNNRMKRSVSGTALLPSLADRCKKIAAHGFIVLACDVRGRGDSDGAFAPFVSEADDGLDTVEWARRLPEGDGTVGLFGSGYAGFAALAAATRTGVDAVAAWSPFATASTPFRGGALRLDWLVWLHLVGGRTPQSVDVPDWPAIFRHRPLISMHEALGRDDIPWPEWLDGTADLRRFDVTTQVAAVAAPILFVTGWWDAELATTVRYWDAVAGSRHALVIGPWDAQAVRHQRPDVGGVAWGPNGLVDQDELLVHWFAAHLKGVGSALHGACAFVTGRNEWIALDVAAPDIAPTPLWLSSGGRANTRRGDGRLIASAPEDAPPDRFIHNPDNPVPWQPDGALWRSSTAELTLNTAFATSRDDVLVYEAGEVASSLVICGRPTARLWVHSNAQDADWVVAIEDAFPGGGGSVHLAHGIARTAVFGDGESDDPIELRIELTPFVHELLPGHRLRLLVASSMWPVYAANLGGADYLHDTTPQLAEHTLLHDLRFPSRLELPVFPVQPQGVQRPPIVTASRLSELRE